MALSIYPKMQVLKVSLNFYDLLPDVNPLINSPVISKFPSNADKGKETLENAELQT